MIRKVLIAVAVLVAILVVAAVALVTLVDVDRFKPQIQQAVADRFGRTLTIDGKLSLSVFPRIAVALPAMTLSEPGSTKEAARLGGAKVSVAVMPLVRGSLVADRVVVDGLSARIERRADGSTSIDDLLGRSPGAPATRPEPGGSPGTMPALDVGGVSITNAKVVIDDRKAGNTMTIDRLALDTGRLADGATTPVSLSFAFAQTAPKAAGTVAAKAEVMLDPRSGRYEAKGLSADLRATLDELAVDAKLQATRVDAGPTSVTVDGLTVDATSTQGSRRIVARLSAPVKGDLSTGAWQSASLAGQVAIDDPRIPSGKARLDLAGSASANTTKQNARADLSAKGEGTSLAAKVGIDGFTKPRITFDVSADQLDVDRFVPAKKTAAPASPAPAQQPSGGGQDKPAPIDLSALRDLNLDGRVAISRLQVRGLSISDLGVGVKATGGRLDASPIAAAVYGGKFAGKATVQAGATPQANRIGLDADLTGISILPLLKDLADKDLLDGRGNVRVAVQTGGATSDAMKRALDGTVALALRDGSIRGINLGETLRNARNLLTAGNSETRKTDRSQKTDFTELNMTAKIAEGVARSDDLDVKSPLLRIGGAGTANLVTDTIDYTVRVSVVGTSTGQGGKDLDDVRGVTIPVRLTGALAAPGWQIDWATAGRDALKSRAASELKERLKTDELRDKARDKARERIDDALKGLLGR